MEYQKRRTTRLKGYDYNMPGYYFITICTRDKQKLLCDIVGTGLLDGPQIRMLPMGKIAEKQLQLMSDFYDDIRLEKYVIMPNHIHLLIHILGIKEPQTGDSVTNSKIAKFVGTFKRFSNKEYGMNIWQYRSHDHVIRGEQDYLKIWQYIEENPLRWADDCFYAE